MKDDYRQHSRNIQEYKEGYKSIGQENPYEGGTVAWLNWLIGKEEANELYLS